MSDNNIQYGLKKISTGIGAGIIAGLAGTAAITACQMIEMKITKRKPGMGPATAVQKTLKVYPKPGTKKRMAFGVHWVYGTLWGIVRGMLGITGLNNWVATGAHFTAVTTTGMAIAPLQDQSPVTEWSAKDIAIDIVHHTVYALVAGLVFDAIYDEE